MEKFNEGVYFSSRELEAYIDTEFKKVYIYLSNKEMKSILYIYGLKDKKKIEIEFDCGIAFESVINFNKIIVMYGNINMGESKSVKQPEYSINYKANSYRLLDLTYIFDTIN